MDLFQHRYYRFNKTLMTVIGYWPYQSILSTYVLRVLAVFIFISQTIPMIMAVAKCHDDWSIVLESTPALLFGVVFCTKWIGFMWNSQKWYGRWLKFVRIDKYLIGLLILRTGMVYVTMFAFVFQPALPKIIDILLKNGTELGTLPYPVNYYFIDEQKYYFYIMMHCCVCVCFGVSILIAGDVILIIYVHHVCGVFAALGHKLQRIVNNDRWTEKKITPYALEERDMGQFASCIDRHNDAIEYANLVEASHRWVFFFIIGFGMVLSIAFSLQILLGISNPKETVRLVMCYVGTGVHLYVTCYISQNLMDHSSSVGLSVNDSRWYRLSPRIQKVLQLITMRCNVPCKLTTGKMFTMSMTTFLLVCKTTSSYFMFVRSMHGF